MIQVNPQVYPPIVPRLLDLLFRPSLLLQSVDIYGLIPDALGGLQIAQVRGHQRTLTRLQAQSLGRAEIHARMRLVRLEVLCGDYVLVRERAMGREVGEQARVAVAEGRNFEFLV